jgi:hypothetical protein
MSWNSNKLKVAKDYGFMEPDVLFFVECHFFLNDRLGVDIEYRSKVETINKNIGEFFFYGL